MYRSNSNGGDNSNMITNHKVRKQLSVSQNSSLGRISELLRVLMLAWTCPMR